MDRELIENLIEKLGIDNSQKSKILIDTILKEMSLEISGVKTITFGRCRLCKDFAALENEKFKLCLDCFVESSFEYKGNEEKYSFEDFLMAKKLANELENY